MKPDRSKILLGNRHALIEEMLQELVLSPRLNALKWSRVTHQTPNIKIGYPGQHLASLVTGMPGERTGARGHDLADGSEVKSCSRIDQLDACLACKGAVSRSEDVCATCGSSDILRRNDSKWLFTIRSENDLRVLLDDVPRVVLLIGDYPNFAGGDYTTLRFQAYEIWPSHPRCARFRELMTNYYKNIYLGHRAKDAEKTPAPKNFWPESFQFYTCNPVLVFSCTVKDANTSPAVSIDYLLGADVDRESVESVRMPLSVLTPDELALINKKAKPQELQRCMVGTGTERKLGFIDEQLRSYLPVRPTDRVASAKTAYKRGSRS